MRKSIRTKTNAAITAAIAAAIATLAIIAVGCNNGEVNSGGESDYLDRFLDVFSKNPGHNNDTIVVPPPPATYTLTINVSPVEGGTVSRVPDLPKYDAGTYVSVTAETEQGYTFIGWTGASDSKEATVTIRMDGDRTLTPIFGKEGAKKFTVSFNGNGTTNGATPTPSATTADSGTAITLPDQGSLEKTGYIFAGWNTRIDGTGTDYPAKSSYIITEDNITLYAKWTLATYTVTVSGGSGATGSGTYAAGTTVSINAGTAPSGYTFKNWTTNSNGVTFAEANKAATSFTMPSNAVTVSANFEPIKYAVTVSSSGTGATGSGNYAAGETVYINAGTPPTGQRFKNWTASGVTLANANSAATSFTMPGNAVTVTAVFEAVYTLTINRNPTNGGTTTPASATIAAGQQIGISATPANGYTFTNWTISGSSTIADSNSTSTTVTVNGNVTVTANFQQQYTLTTNVSPAGGGNVSRNPDRQYYSPGTRVTVTAMAANGYVFKDWSGDVSGTTSQVAITMNGNKTLTANFYPIEMVFVAGGTFTMGCTDEQKSDCNGDEKPAHIVTLSNYYIGKYEVTQGLWKAVMDTLPSRLASPSNKNGYGDNYPVYYVSWNDIVNNFIPKLNQLTGKTYRLPTEAEWEYAARGGANSLGYKYSGSNTLVTVAWYGYYSGKGTGGTSGETTNLVGTKSPNELGIYDMSGNVWEWVSDWYSSNYYNTFLWNVNDPTGPTTGSYRVRRGGSWYSNAGDARVSFRLNYESDTGFNASDVGFRLVLQSP